MEKTPIHFLLAAVFSLSAQDNGYDNDNITVQNILDRCGLKGASVQDFSVFENGRVISLNLKNRDISKDGIAFLPPEIGDLTALRELNCSGNIIDSIPSEIGELKNLEKLDLSSNRIVIISPAIGKLSRLTHLDLRHNRIIEIPQEIEQCRNLTALQLWGNKLVSLNDAVTRLPALQDLYLNDNRLTSLPANIIKIKLRYIDFSGNRLCTLDESLKAWACKKDFHFIETQKCW